MSAKAAVMSALAQMNERPEAISKSLRSFERAARLLSSNQPRLTDEYPEQWVAVTDSKVLAHGDTLEQVLQQVDTIGVLRSDVIVRYIERNLRTLIL